METLAALLDATAARSPEREAVAHAPRGEVVAALPRNAANKVQTGVLRRQFGG